MTKRKLLVSIIIKLIVLCSIITVLNVSVNAVGTSLSNDLAMQELQNTDMPYYFMKLWNMFVNLVGISELILIFIFGGFIISDIRIYKKGA